ncbi:ATP-binding cassette domain-containing protein [Silvanigrella paludirubra]|uniref:ATP-binding cassette domain-containing protein n=1 Tax=Silvanigrella paludirubra TaxID=2499159 RepID=A0A6N6VRV4_9BACT|nr:ABC transporter ATP-binding protein [Silvanigrella paludirubra]KAB8038852.1 ATP-binding cassette domain-containing protein [Silvanigrella paludirubra]
MKTINQLKEQSPAIEFRNVTKSFGNVIANNQITFSVEKGTIQALVGENGAGKSTAMKILFGLYKEDSGEILVNGKPQHWVSPKDAIKNGIGMVHQHFMLAETATGLDNIILGDEEHTLKLPFIPIPFNIIDRKKAKKEIEDLAKKYGLNVPLNVKISKLPVGMQQRIEILKLLYRNADILILDEPTAVLTPLEVDELFENLKKLKNEGKTIIIVTHKLREVLNLTDNIVVFRTGKVVGEIKTSEATEEKIASMMVGRNVNLRPDIPCGKNIKNTVLELSNVTLKDYLTKDSKRNLLNNISINIKGGEIVGIAGVEGNGQSELLDLIFHPQIYFGKKPSANNFASGKIHLLGRDVTYKKSSQMQDLIVGFIPEDRHKNGLLLNMSAEENYILGRHWEKKFRFGILQKIKEIQKTVKSEMEKYDVRPKNSKLNASGFSGGNQQKIIIAREFGKEPEFIVAANPTRGVDIGAIEYIHQQIVLERDKGVGVLLVSSELDEIITLSDRILVMYGGSIVAEFKRNEADEHLLGLAMCGGLSKENGRNS